MKSSSYGWRSIAERSAARDREVRLLQKIEDLLRKVSSGEAIIEQLSEEVTQLRAPQHGFPFSQYSRECQSQSLSPSALADGRPKKLCRGRKISKTGETLCQPNCARDVFYFRWKPQLLAFTYVCSTVNLP